MAPLNTNGTNSNSNSANSASQSPYYDPVTQLFAGSAAAIVQTSLTQPFEFLKTTLQLQRRNSPAITFPSLTYFTGTSILSICGVTKTFLRFGTFGLATEFLSKETSLDLAPGVRTALAGIITGAVESVWIIPFENVKTVTIQNTMLPLTRQAASAKQLHQQQQQQQQLLSQLATKSSRAPTFHKASSQAGAIKETLEQQKIPDIAKRRLEAFKYYEAHSSPGMLDSIKEIYLTRGFRGYWQGTFPTIFRQLGNSSVSFITYATLRQLALGSGNDEIVSESLATVLGVVSSVAVVGVTQPIDVVKTRMQSKYAWREYGSSSIRCCYRLVTEEGYAALWKGAVPRLFKVGLSGGISFAIYQYFENFVNTARRDGYLS